MISCVNYYRDYTTTFEYDECGIELNAADFFGPHKAWPGASPSECFWILPTPENFERIIQS